MLPTRVEPSPELPAPRATRREVSARLARSVRLAQGPLGVAGVAFATWMLSSKAAVIAIAGFSAVRTVPLVANLALLGGSLMFLREALRALKERKTRVEGPERS